MIKLIEMGLGIIDKIIPDKKAREQAKLKLLDLEQTGELKIIESQSSIITSEARSDSWLARNWRPMIMCLFGVIIANNYIIAPWLHGLGLISVSLPIPDKMWSLLEIGLGGYVVGRSMEKGIQLWNAK